MRYGKYKSKWKDKEIWKKGELNSEMIWKIQKKIANGKYRRKVSWIVIRYGKYGRKVE